MNAQDSVKKKIEDINANEDVVSTPTPKYKLFSKFAKFLFIDIVEGPVAPTNSTVFFIAGATEHPVLFSSFGTHVSTFSSSIFHPKEKPPSGTP
jgi:hypothetical protein